MCFLLFGWLFKLFSVFFWQNRNLLLVLAKTFKLNNAGSQCEQSVVATAANVLAWVDLSTALPVDDSTGVYKLTVSALCAQTTTS